MAWVWRKLQCGLGHSFERLMERGSPAPDDCPVCAAVVQIVPPSHEPADARSDTVAAPALRGGTTKAVARFEEYAMKRPHFDDGSPMLTNLKDNVREGESYVVPETPSSNSIHAFMREQQQRAKDTPNAQNMAAMGGGWGPAGAAPIASLGGQPQNTFGRPVVDLQSKAKPA